MKIYETAVKKPISTILIFVGVIVFGLFSLQTLSIDMYPEMDLPTVTVMTTYEGANAADIETNITRVLEDNLNTVDNLDKITSKSSDNISMVTLEFEWGADLDVASNDVRDVIGRVQKMLPEEAETPMIFKFSSSMIPVVMLYATADESYEALYKLLDDKLVNTLNRVNGVGAVSMMGQPEREIQINVDPSKLEAYGLSVEQIGQLVVAENRDTPAGTIDVGGMTLSVRAKGEFEDSKNLDNIVVANVDGRQVYLPEVATIIDTIKKVTLDERVNTRPAVRIIVQKQSGANSVAIARDVLGMLPGIQAQMPPDVQIGVLVDMSQSIRDSISSLSDTIMYAFFFVFIVVLFFLGRWRATFIIILTIPISLIVSFIYLKVTGSTLNIISLSSLSIAIGMVVDDAIVVLENITKHIEHGSTPKNAAIYATNEVWLAVIATTLVVVAVFLPLTMLPGMAGIMFRELGWIVTLVTVVSTIAAITMTPMLAALMLKAEQREQKKKSLASRIFSPIERLLDRLDEGYRKILMWSVRHRAMLLVVALGIFVASIFLLKQVPSEFFPKTDNGRITARVELEQSVNVQYTMDIARRIDSFVMNKFPEVTVVSASSGTAAGDNIFAAMQKTGSHIINYNFSLPPVAERNRSIFEITDSLRSFFAGMPEVVQSTVTAGAGGPSSSESDISVKVYGYDMMQTELFAKQLKDKIVEVHGATDVQLSRDEMRPEFRVIFDRARLGNYGLTTATASMYVRNRINGLLASKYREDGDEYDIYVRYDEKYRTTVEDIEEITIYNAMNKPIKLKDVAQVREEFAAPTIERENRERMIAVNVMLASGAALSDVVAGIQEEIAAQEIPEGVFIEIGGTYEDQQESFGDLMMLLLLIIILVYIVMATQFESFKMPFIILFSLPFAFTGVFLALFITNTALSVIALIGAIMLVGIVVKNGIVMVDFANLLRERGLSVSQAVIAAGKSRLRPVLMTTLTTVLGMLPLAMGLGEGSETWQPMGIAVIGGLTFSTVLTLIVVPIVYTLFMASNITRERKQIRKANR